MNSKGSGEALPIIAQHPDGYFFLHAILIAEKGGWKMKIKLITLLSSRAALIAALTLLLATSVQAAGTWANAQAADVVLGQSNFACNSFGVTAGLLPAATGVAVDPTTGKVFVANVNASRILRFSSASAMVNGAPAEAVLGQADFCSDLPNRGGSAAANTLYFPLGIFVDSGGRL